jgi:iron complex outermembrane receptor protein
MIGLFAAAAEPGRIEGRVTKDDEGVGAVVVIVSELKLTTVTEQDGTFFFESVDPGGYTLVFSHGDDTATRMVIVDPGAIARADLEIDWEIGIVEEVEVTAVQRAAKIVDAPAAVTSIPSEEIQVQASHGQVPKVLEFTPGAEITQSGLYDFNFNTRGFNSSLNRRVSTYIDGRDVSVVLLGAQEWAAISGGLDDVERLDFVRGPSAALYGANASSGVLNITTKAPRDTQGAFLRLTGGDLETRSLDFRLGDDLGRGWYSKFAVGVKNSGDFSVSRNPWGRDNIEGTDDDLEAPEYSTFCRRVGDPDCLPEEKSLVIEQDNEIYYGALRLDKYQVDEALLTFDAGWYSIEGPVFQTGIGRVQIIKARRPFFRVNWSDPHWNVLGHYATRTGDQTNLIKNLPDIWSRLYTDTKRFGFEAQGNWWFLQEKLRWVIGTAHTEERVDSADPETGEQTVVFESIDANRQAVFTQLDWRANRFLSVVLAGRVDRSTLHDTQFSPKVALVYRINPKNSIRLTYNQAFQVANYSEFFLQAKIDSFPIGGFARAVCSPGGIDCGFDEDEFIPIVASGQDDLVLEKTKAWEFGYTGLLGKRVFITADYYSAKNDNFITDLIPQIGTVFGDIEGCVDPGGNPVTDPRECPINNAFRSWVGPDEAENTILVPNSQWGPLSYADALRNAANIAARSGGAQFVQDHNGNPVIVARTYTNFGQVDTQGIDFGLQYFITRAWGVQASYSWFDYELIDVDARCREFFTLPSDQLECRQQIEALLLPNSPGNKASLGVSYAKNRWAGSLAGRWVDGFRWSAGVFAGDVPTECDPVGCQEGEFGDYTTIDLNLSYAVNNLMRIGLNVANLRDTVHRQTFGGDLLSRRALLNVTFAWW